MSECLDQAAIDKIRQAAKGNLPSAPHALGQSNSVAQLEASQQMPFILSFNSARALIRLNGKVVDLPAAVHAALDTTLSRRLKTNKIEALVKSLVEGNGDKPTIRDKNQPTTNIPEDLKKVLELFKKVEAEIARGDGQTTYQDELRALLKGTAETVEDENSGKKGKAGKKSKSSSGNEPSLFWEWMLGVKFMNQLRSKAKKGELTTTDRILIILDRVVVGPLGWVLKHLGKLTKGTAKTFWHWLKKTLGKTFSNLMKWAIPLLIICAFLWGAGKVFQFVVVKPLHWIESKAVSGFHWGGHSDESLSRYRVPSLWLRPRPRRGFPLPQ